MVLGMEARTLCIPGKYTASDLQLPPCLKSQYCMLLGLALSAHFPVSVLPCLT